MRRLLAASAVFLSACIIEAPSSSGRESTQRPTAAPPVEVRSGANFGDKIELTSVSLSPGKGTTGESVKVTAAFTVMAKTDIDYMIFVHVEDVDGRVDRINVDHAPGRGANPTSHWEVGTVVRDEFEIPIPPNMPVRGLNLVMGFWDPKTDARLPVKNADKVRNDGRDRVFVATFPVTPPG